MMVLACCKVSVVMRLFSEEKNKVMSKRSLHSQKMKKIANRICRHAFILLAAC
jgi:hypothetical protein